MSTTAITPFKPAPSSTVKALPVCGWHPPGGCVIVQPDCTYPPGTNFCGAHAVPANNGLGLALLVLLLGLIAFFALRSKP